MHKDGEKNKNKKSIKRYQNYIYQFQYEADVLVQPLKVAHSLSTNGFNKPG
jgi:hypothetical protein